MRARGFKPGRKAIETGVIGWNALASADECDSTDSPKKGNHLAHPLDHSARFSLGCRSRGKGPTFARLFEWYVRLTTSQFARCLASSTLVTDGLWLRCRVANQKSS